MDPFERYRSRLRTPARPEKNVLERLRDREIPEGAVIADEMDIDETSVLKDINDPFVALTKGMAKTLTNPHFYSQAALSIPEGWSWLLNEAIGKRPTLLGGADNERYIPGTEMQYGSDMVSDVYEFFSGMRNREFKRLQQDELGEDPYVNRFVNIGGRFLPDALGARADVALSELRHVPSVTKGARNLGAIISGKAFGPKGYKAGRAVLDSAVQNPDDLGVNLIPALRDPSRVQSARWAANDVNEVRARDVVRRANGMGPALKNKGRDADDLKLLNEVGIDGFVKARAYKAEADIIDEAVQYLPSSHLRSMAPDHLKPVVKELWDLARTDLNNLRKLTPAQRRSTVEAAGIPKTLREGWNATDEAYIKRALAKEVKEGKEPGLRTQRALKERMQKLKDQTKLHDRERELHEKWVRMAESPFSNLEDLNRFDSAPFRKNFGKELGWLKRAKLAFQNHWLSRASKNLKLEAKLDPEGAKALDELSKVSDQSAAVQRAYIEDLQHAKNQLWWTVRQRVKHIGWTRTEEAERIGKTMDEIGKTLGDIRAGKKSADILPPDIREAFEMAGSKIDELGAIAADMGLMSPKNLKSMRHIGSEYVHRTYRAYRDPDWLDEVRKDHETWGNMYEFLMQNKFREKLPKDVRRGMTPEQIDEAKLAIREDPDTRADIITTMEEMVGVHLKRKGENPLGIIPSEILDDPKMEWLVQRKALADPVKKFLGMDENFFYQYDITTAAISRDIAKAGAQQAGLDALRKGGLVRRPSERIPGMNFELGGGAGQTEWTAYAPKDVGQWYMLATENAAEYSANLMHQLAQTWKLSKTVASALPTGVRNVMSTWFPYMMSGEFFRPGGWNDVAVAAKMSMAEVLGRQLSVKGGKVVANTLDDATVGLTVALSEQGLMAGAHAGDISRWQDSVAHMLERSAFKSAQRSASKKLNAFGDDLAKTNPELYNKLKTVASSPQGAWNMAKRMYAEGDMLLKRAMVPRMVDEFTQVSMRADDEINALLRRWIGSDDPLEMASEITRNQLQNYNRVSQGIKDLSANAFIGPFVSFTYEQARNAIWNIRYAYREARLANDLQSLAASRAGEAAEGATFAAQVFTARAARRWAGIGMALGTHYAMSHAVRKLYGVTMSHEDEAAFERIGVPDFGRGQSKAFTRREGMQVDYVNTSMVDYFAASKRPISLMAEALTADNKVQLEEALWQVGNSIIGELVGYEGPVEILLETLFNTRIEGNILQTLRGSADPTERPKITTSPVFTERWKEKGHSAAKQALPTWVTVLSDEAGMVPRSQEGRATWGRLNPVFTPVRIDLKKKAKGFAADMEDVRNSFNRDIDKILTDPRASDGKSLGALKKQWEQSTGPKLAQTIQDYARFATAREMRDLFGGVFTKRATRELLNGNVPSFERTFSKRLTRKGLTFLDRLSAQTGD